MTIAAQPHSELWIRQFGTSLFASRLASADRLGIFEERFGALSFLFELEATGEGFEWHLVGWRFGALPLPRALAPRIKAAAEDAHGRYRFRVVVAHVCLGLLFAYRGVLEP